MSAALPDTASFGAWVRRARQAHGLTQDSLAEQVGCATATIRKIEASERRPSFQMASRLAQMLGVAAAEQQDFIQAARAVPEPLPTVPEPASAEQIHHLPQYLTPLVGRTQAQADLRQLLTQPGCRLLTVLGAGGIGKTRLAVDTLEAMNTSGYRIAFVPLTAVRHVAALPTAIADGIGLQLKGNIDILQQVLHQLQAQPTILILDSLEHLLADRALPGLLTSLLTEIQQLKLVVTSRERLRLSGEWVLELPGLSLPSDAQGRDAEHSESVLLFLDRARRMVAGFSLDFSNRSAITQITRMLDGVPLAIELAATWVRLLSCAEIASEIERSLDFLSLADRDIALHHRSMRAVFEYSWQMLKVDEQAILARLAVFQGGFTRDAAAEVAYAQLTDLASLASKSLIMPGKHRRYDLHELLRLFAFEKLASMPAEPGTSMLATTQILHLDYFLQLAEQSAPELEGQQQLALLMCFEEEHENFRAALRFALQSSTSPAVHVSGARLAAALGPFWFIRGHLSAGLKWMQQALDLTEADSQPQARIHTVFGFFALLRHDIPRAREHLEQAIRLSQRYLDMRSEALAWHYLGLVAALEGNNAEDRAAQQQCILIAGQIGESYLIALANVKLGHCERVDGNHEQAEEHYRSGIAYFSAIGDRNQLAAPLRRLGHLLLIRQDTVQALHYFRQSLTLNLEVGDMRATAACLLAIACVYWAQQHTHVAVQLFAAHEQLLQTKHEFLMSADRDESTALASQIRSALVEPGLAQAYALGKQLSLEQAAQIGLRDGAYSDL